MIDWAKTHILRVNGEASYPEPPSESEALAKWIEANRKKIEPWLSAVFQSEHLSLLLGSGFTSGIGHEAGAAATGMGTVTFGCGHEEKLNAYATKKAADSGRGRPNIEDQLSAAITLAEGFRVAGMDTAAAEWEAAIDRVLTGFMRSILQTERAVYQGLAAETEPTEGRLKGHQILISFLMSFASRAASRERLHIFTTNYDRLVEFGCDLAGLRVIDRFVGAINPIFRSSRLQVDLHYNPPGIRGEPRLLEGVVHYTKLHGSIDWRREGRVLHRVPLGFGADADNHPEVPEVPSRSVMIYPNAAKDIETAAYPYADLFRDFSCAASRPNSVLVTYGYGFGDDHVNRVLADMLTIPSTHLVIISYGDGGNEPHKRVMEFCETTGRISQITLLLGNHFANVRNLATHYLPKPAIDPIAFRMVTLLQRRTLPNAPPSPDDRDDGDIDLEDLFK